VAILLIDEVRILAFDEKIDITVWSIERDERHIHGLKYSFNYRVWGGRKWIEIFRYDNGHGSGDHRHVFKKVEAVKFISIENINDELIELIDRYRGEINEIKAHGNISDE